MVKTYHDYVDEIHEKFPGVDKKEIEKILEKGLKNIQAIIHAGTDVHLLRRGNPENYYEFYITFQRKNSIARNVRSLSKLRILEKIRRRRKEKWEARNQQ